MNKLTFIVIIYCFTLLSCQESKTNKSREFTKEHSYKDHHAILRTLTTDRAKIDSMTKWMREGNFYISIVRKNKNSRKVPADSVEYYYWKMKEKEKNLNN